MKKYFLRLMAMVLASAFVLACPSFSFGGTAKQKKAAKYNINNDPVLNAMSEELERSFPVLKKAEKIPLYFLGYEITETESYYLSSEMGAIKSESSGKNRQLDIDARFGSPQLDNTHQVKGYDSNYQGGSYRQKVPFEDDIDALKAKIWEHTDSAVKRAYEAFTKVQMNKALTAQEDDDSPDFSEYKPQRHYDSAEMPSIDKEKARKTLNAISAKMKDYPFIYSGGATLSADTDNRYIVNSDGTKIKTGRLYLRLAYTINSRTADGMDISRSMDYNAEKMSDFPSEKKLIEDFRKSAAELDALRNAPLAEPFSGPAIMNARAAGVYFHEIIGHRLEGHRQKLEDSGQTFAKKLGEKVTADFITLYDDPTVSHWNGIPLRGHYLYDDEGSKAEKASLVENGVLKGFLMSRSPIRGFSRSNGHGRKAPGYESAVSRMGNTIVKASRTIPYSKLRQMLIDEIRKQGKPYGLVFDDISGGYTMTGRGSGQTFKVNPLIVYRVYPDGRPDELVRGVDLVGTPIANFAKIAAAADDYSVFNGDCGAETGWVPVSAVAPSMLITEIETEKSQKSQARLPVLPPPPTEAEKTEAIK